MRMASPALRRKEQTMRLSELLTGFSYQVVQGEKEVEVTELVFDSRKTIVPGAVFVQEGLLRRLHRLHAVHAAVPV